MLWAIGNELTAEAKQGVFVHGLIKDTALSNRHPLKQIINETCIYIHVIAI